MKFIGVGAAMKDSASQAGTKPRSRRGVRSIVRTTRPTKPAPAAAEAGQ